MKFELAYKDLTHPVFFARTAAWAGVQQAADTPNYRQGAKGYGERLGAGLADATTEGLIGNAILPSLLHQDPRYFYQGTGTKRSRALHAILAPFICKGDNGASQPNYSTWGGSLISSSISIAYYPRFGSQCSGMYSEVLGLAWLCMWAAVWPKSLSWANSQARVSTNFECSQTEKRESAELPDQIRAGAKLTGWCQDL